MRCAVAQPNRHVNNTPSVESIEQNKALMKLLQAFQMPVHISVPLGSTESEIRLGGSQPGNGLRFSSFFFFPAPWKSLGTQGCSARRAAGCQENEGAWVYFYVTLGRGAGGGGGKGKESQASLYAPHQKFGCTNSLLCVLAAGNKQFL